MKHLKDFVREDYETYERIRHKRSKGKRNCFESDYMEVEELVEEYKSRKQEEIQKKHREQRDKYFHDGY